MLAECSGSAGDGQVPSPWRCGVLLCGTSCEPDRPRSCNAYCVLLNRPSLSRCVDLFRLQKGTEADGGQQTFISSTRLLLLAFQCQMAPFWIYTYTQIPRILWICFLINLRYTLPTRPKLNFMIFGFSFLSNGITSIHYPVWSLIG